MTKAVVIMALVLGVKVTGNININVEHHYRRTKMLDFFLSSLFWASIIMLCFFGILIVSDWIITWRELKKRDE